MTDRRASTVWELLREFADAQTGSFTSQEVISWIGRRAPGKATDSTIRVHTRGASWNVADRAQFSHREPFLTRTDRGLFRQATTDEIARWLADNPGAGPSDPTPPMDVEPTPPEEPTRQEEPPSDRRPDRLAAALGETTQLPREWHTEANVQSSLVTALVNAGWRILSVANTATKEHGIDVIAVRDDQTIGVEVKGFPSRNYADPARAGEVKRTQPSTQAAHWYSQAVLAAMRLRGKEPSWRSVIVLPDFPRYRELHTQTVGSLTAGQIEVWWIDASGALSDPTPIGD